MGAEQDIREFVQAIRNALPEAAQKTDHMMRGRGWDSDEGAEYIWVEALADVTNMYVRRRDQQEVEKHLRFFAVELDRRSDAVKNCIDVSYVENLMWDLKREDKAWFWPRIPENLRKLYVAFWGGPTL